MVTLTSTVLTGITARIERPLYITLDDQASVTVYTRSLHVGQTATLIILVKHVLTILLFRIEDKSFINNNFI